MTDVVERARRESIIHWPGVEGTHCTCGSVLPCVTMDLLIEVERLRARIERVQNMRAWAIGRQYVFLASDVDVALDVRGERLDATYEQPMDELVRLRAQVEWLKDEWAILRRQRDEARAEVARCEKFRAEQADAIQRVRDLCDDADDLYIQADAVLAALDGES